MVFKAQSNPNSRLLASSSSKVMFMKHFTYVQKGFLVGLFVFLYFWSVLNFCKCVNFVKFLVQGFIHTIRFWVYWYGISMQSHSYCHCIWTCRHALRSFSLSFSFFMHSNFNSWFNISLRMSIYCWYMKKSSCIWIMCDFIRIVCIY